jgi:hypothetical protein
MTVNPELHASVESRALVGLSHSMNVWRFSTSGDADIADYLSGMQVA